MKQADAVQFLYRDLKSVTSHLVLDSYDRVFEEQMQEYYPFNDTVIDWLSKLYSSEKYGAFDEEKLSFYFEKEHPFLFVRDLAHVNCWNMGYIRKDRRDHITGLMFSSDPVFALEATIAICRPSMIHEEASSWFDFKQAMNNLELADPSNYKEQAWKACGLYYLYFQLSEAGQTIDREELKELLEPYGETLEQAIHSGDAVLRAEAGRVKRFLRNMETRTTMDGLGL